jgi:segregation and condensation protein B
MIEKQQLRKIIEGALLAYGQPLSIDKLHALFVTETTETDEGEQVPTEAQVEKSAIIAVLEEIKNSCDDLGYELKEVSSGWRFQVRKESAPWVNKLWDEKPQRYSRALMETIAIIAYRQPITRGDIEEIRGVAVSSNIIKTLTEREWVKVIGHRDVPGRPALFATTRQFLDYFNLKSLDQLPSLQELTDIDSLNPELNLQAVAVSAENTSEETEVDSITEIDDEQPHNDTLLSSSESSPEGNLESNPENSLESNPEANPNNDTESDEQVVH